MFLLGQSVIGTVVAAVAVIGMIGGAVVWVLEKFAKHSAVSDLDHRIKSEGRLEQQLGAALLYTDPPRFGLVSERLADTVIDRPVYSLETRPITADVTASVASTGSVSVNRGRNLAAKALGAAVVPGGAFFIGNAKETTRDHRELYLLVEGEDWAYTHPVDPARGTDARRFAQAIELQAKAQRPAEPSTPPLHDSTLLDQLERLTRLRDSGALTGDEFEQQKATLLNAAE